MSPKNSLTLRVLRRLFLIAVVAALCWIGFNARGWRGIANEQVSTPNGPIKVQDIELRKRSGVRLFGRGFRTYGQGLVPRLPTTNAFWAAIDSDIARQTEDALEEFNDQLSWSAVWQSVKETSARTYEWSMEATWRTEFVSPRFVSLVATYWEDTGGAHGNTGYGALNAVPDGTSFREVKLPDLFLADVGWRDVLAGAAEREINREKGIRFGNAFSEDLSASVKPDEMNDAVFSATSAGLKIWFAPYEKGAYAEGSFEPVIPYGLFVKMLNTNGPAKWLPCFQDKP